MPKEIPNGVGIIGGMRATKGRIGAAFAVGAALAWMSPSMSNVAAQQAPTSTQRPTFTVQVNLVTTDVVARDEKGNFVSDLTREEFEVYEDGVKQEIVSLTLSHGGRVSNVLEPPPPLAPEGIILPTVRRVNDTSGRIFVFFIDDLHLQFQNAPRVRSLLKKMSTTLLHDGDLFGIVSSGTSSISVQLTYDKKRFDDIIEKVSGDELKPSELINAITGTGGPAEVRHRVRVAMDTVNELINNLEKVHDRRKSIIYVSDGYDFIPFQQSRLGLSTGMSAQAFLQNAKYAAIQDQLQQQGVDNSNVSTTEPNAQGAEEKRREQFADADLAIALAELTRNANRANATIYTVDPRGLVGMPDLDEPIDPRQWSAYILKTQESLREIAEDTGGIAVVSTNDFDRALKRIDADTSDYYVLGYYSSNPDVYRRLRKMDVRVTRKNIDVVARKEYLIRPPVPTRTTPTPAKKP
jgi:VWFA-related protein